MNTPSIRIGQGFDVHAFAPNRKLILGGVHVPYDRGLLGHSDADVLTHAVCNAILGALGRGDIGRHFPDTDPQFKDIDSLRLLDRVVALARAEGYAVAQLDTTIVAQRPKLAPYMDAMRDTLRVRLCGRIEAQDANGPRCIVNVKAATTEHLGYIGRGEGVAAQAIALLVRRDSV